MKLIPLSLIISLLLIAGAWFYPAAEKQEDNAKKERVEGFVLPVKWGDLKLKMLSVGAIDKNKLKEEESLSELNFLWALGLGNKNEILEKGPMADPRYGGPEVFASTGGWTLSEGNSMEHYSRHLFLVLTAEEQKMVEKVAKNIYRPCCDNPAYFPDCNHGMAMLGLLELMASQGASEEEMYKTALQANASWFPEEYQTIAKYLASRGFSWDKADPKEILSAKYSSASGYQKILSQLPPTPEEKGAGCGV